MKNNECSRDEKSRKYTEKFKKLVISRPSKTEIPAVGWHADQCDGMQPGNGYHKPIPAEKQHYKKNQILGRSKTHFWEFSRVERFGVATNLTRITVGLLLITNLTTTV